MATYKIVSHGGNGLPLNVERNTSSAAQKWKISKLSDLTSCYKMYSMHKNSVI